LPEEKKVKNQMISENIQSSFRDPSGFLFKRGGNIYRQVNTDYKENYVHLINSGLYKALVGAELLIPHEELDTEAARHDKFYKIIKPVPIPFISYPYEWSFSQLKDAALITLEIQKKSLNFAMSLKDCSAYNIQFKNGKPIFIDTLSFERYREGQPWVAYRQFCQHFLAPLALMSYRDVRLSQLLRLYIDGIPLDLASSLLPYRTRFIFSLFIHVHLHAKSQRYFADKTVNKNIAVISRSNFLSLIDNLESAVKKLKWTPRNSEWALYYKETSYSEKSFNHKKETVSGFLKEINPKNVWDLGANIGIFSRIAAERGIQTLSFDSDPAAVERNYLTCIERGERNVLPLVLDLTNPSPNIGWQNEERSSIVERGPADTALALALVHHLVISNNLTFDKIAEFFDKVCNSLIIEFVPKSDSQVQRLLLTREDIFPDYKQDVFEREFGKYFEIKRSVTILDSDRILYLMQKKET
jgi:hypothetical protein